jgi:hypothetical protein
VLRGVEIIVVFLAFGVSWALRLLASVAPAFNICLNIVWVLRKVIAKTLLVKLCFFVKEQLFVPYSLNPSPSLFILLLYLVYWFKTSFDLARR